MKVRLTAIVDVDDETWQEGYGDLTDAAIDSFLTALEDDIKIDIKAYEIRPMKENYA